MSEILQSKVYNGRTDKYYAPDETPEGPLAWWREARPEADGLFKIVRVNFDFGSSTKTVLPSAQYGEALVDAETARKKLTQFEHTCEIHGYNQIGLPELV